MILLNFVRKFSSLSSFTIQQVLKRYWSYDQFRPLQEEIVLSVLDAKDTLALMPTGGGKSICFQVPGLALEGICLVVSPLIALMKDQVAGLKAKGIKAEYIISGMSYRDIDTILDNCVYGPVKFLYLSPERLASSLVIERISRMKVNLIAVDEAHCISQWGHDFRPAYLKIKDLRKVLPDVPMIALTATATTEVKKDILDQLELKDAAVFSKSFLRTNLEYSVYKKENKVKGVLDVLASHPGSSIVYVRTRKQVREISDLLRQNGISAAMYHAGLHFSEREKAQTDWISNKIRVIVATNAFGMGIDKPDVRSVIHWAPPSNLEAYYQEAGRAGRDEKKAEAFLFYSAYDLAEAERLFKLNFPSIEEIRAVYQAMANYLSLAVGSGEGETYNFDLAVFVSRFKLDSGIAYNSLKVLERNGLIYLSDAVFNPSQLSIIAEPYSLRLYIEQQPTYEPLFQLLLRSYGGIYEQPVRISEASLGKSLGWSEDELSKSLNFLSAAGVISYVAKTDLPQLSLMSPRLDARYLHIDYTDYKQRKLILRTQLDALLNYISNKGTCRNQMLLNYFGENLERPCGICDFCKTQQNVKPDYTVLETKLCVLLAGRSYTLKEIKGLFPEIDESLFSNWLRKLTDRGLIIITNGFELSLKK